MNDKKIGCVQHDCQECQARERQSVPAGLQNIDRSVIEQALEWVEAQPEPRMLGAAKIITALREALSQPQPVQQAISEIPNSWFPGIAEKTRQEAWRIFQTSPQEAQPQPVQQEPVAAQQRFRHPQKTMPDWSPWQPCKVADRPAWQIDSQGYEVEYRDLYTTPQAAQPLTEKLISELWDRAVNQAELNPTSAQAPFVFARLVQAVITKGTT